MLMLLALLATDPSTALTSALTAASPGAIAPGRYGLVMRIVTEADAAVVGKVTTTTTTTALVDISIAEGRVIASQRACSMLTDGGMFQARGARGFVEAMAPVSYEIKVDGSRITADLGLSGVAVAAGARSLPANREAFTDPDNDGHKGAPLDVEFAGLTLRLDIATIGHAVLEGTIRDGRMSGRPRVLFSDERILGGPEFATGGTKEVVAARSTFAFEPLPAGASCAAAERLAVR